MARDLWEWYLAAYFACSVIGGVLVFLYLIAALMEFVGLVLVTRSLPGAWWDWKLTLRYSLRWGQGALPRSWRY